ncbi:MAG TPA: response regulator [Nocardioidaceae bacterium]|nr:response regulator [Nocardioidaceae bacterium]
MRGDPARVLVVDDVPEMRRLLATVLNLRGMTVVGEAADGRQAVRLADDLQPDVVILDLGLPDLQGQDVLTGIRNHAPQVRVVVFSGLRPSGGELASSVEAYVGKEQDIDILVDAVESVAQLDVELVVHTYPRVVDSIAQARAATAEVLGSWGMGSLAADSLVVVSELTTNALVHAGTAFELRLSRHPRSVRIAVLDHGPGTPEPLAPSTVRPHGRGLQIVDAMSSAWGVSGLKKGTKLVWAELPLSPEVSASGQRTPSR